jgi:O-antigen ligase
MPTDRLFLLCTIVLAACLFLGGGTRAGFLSDAVVELLAIPLLLIALGRIAGLPSLKGARSALLLCLGIALVPALQLVPLPPSVWAALPGRETVIEPFRLLGQELPWMPLSLSPRATWLSALSLLPPVAVFLATLLIGYRERRALTLILIGFGVLSAFVGLAQVAEGPSSGLRFFAVTNPSEAVGFFANRNHFAAALYVFTLLAAAWAVEAASKPQSGETRLDTRWIVPVVASLTVLAVLVAAQAMARSRAGLGLTIAALVGATAIALRDRRSTSGITPAKLVLASAAGTVIYATQFALYRILDRFSVDPMTDARLPIGRVTSEAAQLYMPLGSGMGTFVPVYGLQERPADAALDAFVNRAHNDLLELWLETGVAGPALAVAALLWLAVRSASLWRQQAPGSDIDLAIARAATIVVALIGAHSLVDYPLRTGAIMAITAFACGLLVAPLAGAPPEPPDRGQPSRKSRAHGRRTPRPPDLVPATANAPISQHTPERWGNDIEWPKDWR